MNTLNLTFELEDGHLYFVQQTGEAQEDKEYGRIAIPGVFLVQKEGVWTTENNVVYFYDPEDYTAFLDLIKDRFEPFSFGKVDEEGVIE